MTVKNRNMAARDIILWTVHSVYGDGGCNHDVDSNSWTGQREAYPCVIAAQEALTKLGEANIHVVTDDAATDGHDHAVMFVDKDVWERLRSFLHRLDTPRGMGYSAFITWALNTAETAQDSCENDGSGYCMVHHGYNHLWTEGDGEDFSCDLVERVTVQ